MTVAREEIFGPVLCVLDFDDEDEVIARANDTEYGLAAGAWTSDLEPRDAGDGRAEGGNDLDEHVGRYRSRVPLWRYETERIWPRNGRRGHRALFANQKRLDRVE